MALLGFAKWRHRIFSTRSIVSSAIEETAIREIRAQAAKWLGDVRYKDGGAESVACY